MPYSGKTSLKRKISKFFKFREKPGSYYDIDLLDFCNQFLIRQYK